MGRLWHFCGFGVRNPTQATERLWVPAPRQGVDRALDTDFTAEAGRVAGSYPAAPLGTALQHRFRDRYQHSQPLPSWQPPFPIGPEEPGSSERRRRLVASKHPGLVAGHGAAGPFALDPAFQPRQPPVHVADRLRQPSSASTRAPTAAIRPLAQPMPARRRRRYARAAPAGPRGPQPMTARRRTAGTPATHRRGLAGRRRRGKIRTSSGRRGRRPARTTADGAQGTSR